MVEDPNASGESRLTLLTFREAQSLLRVSHQTLYKLMGQGLPSHKIGGRRMFIEQEVLVWVKSQ